MNGSMNINVVKNCNRKISLTRTAIVYVLCAHWMLWEEVLYHQYSVVKWKKNVLLLKYILLCRKIVIAFSVRWGLQRKF